MAGETISLEWPREDWERLRAQMRRATNELGRTLPQAVRFGAWAVAGALGTSTAVSERQRAYRTLPTTRRRPQRKFEIDSYKSGKLKPFVKHGILVRDIRSSRKIAARGLAKAAWGWGIAATGRRAGAFKDTTPWARKLAGELMDVDRSRARNRDNPQITLTNKLPYAMRALGRGERDVSDAIARAARRMGRVIDHNLKRAGLT